MRPDWMDPGHDLPKAGTYRTLDAFVDGRGEVFVGNRAIQVLPAHEVLRCLRDLLGWIPADQPEHQRVGELLTRIERAA